MVHLVKFNPIQNGVFILVEVSFRILTTDETWYPGGVNLSCLTGVIGCACTYTCQVTRLPRAGGSPYFTPLFLTILSQKMFVSCTFMTSPLGSAVDLHSV